MFCRWSYEPFDYIEIRVHLLPLCCSVLFVPFVITICTHINEAEVTL